MKKVYKQIQEYLKTHFFHVNEAKPAQYTIYYNDKNKVIGEIFDKECVMPSKLNFDKLEELKKLCKEVDEAYNEPEVR